MVRKTLQIIIIGIFVTLYNHKTIHKHQNMSAVIMTAYNLRIGVHTNLIESHDQ